MSPIAQLTAAADLFDALALLLCGLDGDGKIVIANRRCEEVTGLGAAALIGLDWRTLFAAGARGDEIAALWEGAARGESASRYEGLCRRGRRLQWHFSRWPHLDGALCAAGIDITDERDRQSRSRSAERMTTVANLGAGLAHELRNPLNSASLQLALVQRKLGKSPLADQLGPYLAEATRELLRTAAVLDDFLVFARPRAVVLERVELALPITRAVDRVRARADAAGVELASDVAPHTLVEIDPGHLEDALYNLLTNAVDASAEAELRRVAIRGRFAGSDAVIEVEDRGPGLPSPDSPVFDPFFTTKASGTGLGLAIVERVATDHGGTVQIERTGGATIFRLRLPIVAGESVRGMAPDYRRVFEALPDPVVVLEPSEPFRIEAVSEGYLRSAHTTRDAVVGRPSSDVFADGVRGQPVLDDSGRVVCRVYRP